MLKKRFIVSDIETTDFKENLENLESYVLDFKLGCFIEYDIETLTEINRFSFTNQKEYISKLLEFKNKRISSIVYFHNLAFDSKFFISELLESQIFGKIELVKNGNHLLAIKCYEYLGNQKRKTKTLEIRDSLSILLKSIEKLGLLIDLPKLEFNFNYDNIQKAILYCFRDCEILAKSLFYLIHSIYEIFNYDLELKHLPLTIASLGKQIIKLFYPDVYYQVDLHIEQHCREYYFGGRTEVFNFNTLYNGIYIDCNSLYPFVLSKYDYSYGKTFRYRTDKFLKRNDIIAYECIIDESLEFPLFPEKCLENKILFKNGLKKAIIPIQILDFLRENHILGNGIKIKQILSAFITCKKINFKLFFQNVYKVRNTFDSNHFFNYFLKILMNAIYGKFGQLPVKENRYFIREFESTEYKKFKSKELRITENLDGTLIAKQEIFQYYSTLNLFNAILTTSYARFELWKKILECQEKEIDIYYCDTDSLTIKPNDIHKLSDLGKELGQWKIEYYVDLFRAFDSKEYLLQVKDEYIIKFKGIKNKSLLLTEQEKEQKTLSQIDKIKQHYKYGTKQQIIASIFYCIARNEINYRTNFIINKEKSSYYYKREIQKDLTTKPLIELTDTIIQNNRELLMSLLTT